MRIFACLAVTLDGKIASKQAPRERFGSKADLAHLLAVRNQADAILSGGETFRQFSGARKGNASDRIPIQCIVTRSFKLPPNAALFREARSRDIPVIIFSPEPAPSEICKQYPSSVTWVTVGTQNPVPVILDTLAQRGVKTLDIEGGGWMVGLFLEAQALQELYLTLCPLFLGNPNDPALVSSLGFSIGSAPRTEVISADWKEQELFLHLKISYP